MSTKKTSRRSFIQKTLLATGGLVLASNFLSCKKDDDFSLQTINATGFSNINFNEGVASFDPSDSKVIIWTRYNAPGKSIVWQVATDIEFNNILRDGTITTEASRDNTIAVELTELDADLKIVLSIFK